jgi:serine/threonine protein kinase
MKSMVCDYPSVQREIKAYEALTKVSKTSGSTGKRYVRQALDHFELRHGDRNYDFLIHEPLGLHVQLFLDIFGGSFPIPYVKLLATQMLRALEFIHSAQVIHSGLTSSDNTLCRLIHLGL